MMYDNHYIVKVHSSDGDDVVSVFSVNAGNRVLAVQNVIKDLPVHAKETIRRVDIVEQYQAVMEIK